MSFSSVASKTQAVLAKAGSVLRSPVLLAMRLYWGYGFWQTGTGKLQHFDRTLGFFTHLGLPFPKLNVYMAAGTEAGCGILLAIGLCSRIVSLPLLVVMGVAYATAEKEALHAIFTDPDKFVSADPFLFALTALIVLAFGPGYFSIARWLFGKDVAGSVR